MHGPVKKRGTHTASPAREGEPTPPVCARTPLQPFSTARARKSSKEKRQHGQQQHASYNMPSYTCFSVFPTRYLCKTHTWFSLVPAQGGQPQPILRYGLVPKALFVSHDVVSPRGATATTKGRSTTANKSGLTKEQTEWRRTTLTAYSRVSRHNIMLGPLYPTTAVEQGWSQVAVGGMADGMFSCQMSSKHRSTDHDKRAARGLRGLHTL